MYPNNMLDVTDPDAPIYRIFSKSRFLDLLRTRKNGLVNPAKWDDPFENFFLRASVTGPNGEVISISNLAKDWYGQCWTLHEDTDAMWRIYSPGTERDSIKVRTTIRKLFESLYDDTDSFAALKYVIGTVSYETEAEIAAFMSGVTFQDIAFGGKATPFARLLCVKREAFAHEKEVRLLFQDLDPKRGANRVALFDFDVNGICDDVVLDPRLTETEAAALADELKRAGCTLPIGRSPLYRVPAFSIRLQ